MNYEETLHYLFEQLPMFQRIGAPAFKKDLTNTIRLCELLNNPQNKFPSIHIAGTNGKGTVSHILAAVLQAGGVKVGLYTSPHYKDFRERIRINGNYIGEHEVVQFTEKMKPDMEKIEPSFFEITVAMAFHHFAENHVDIAVIETGLGGRLDSTNVIKPVLSVITNIGLEHTQFLGTTLPAIAGEKAGIIKEKVPVVIGETNFETAPVFIHTAKIKDADIRFADQYIKIDVISRNIFGTEFNVYENKEPVYENVKTILTGDFQLRNMTTAIGALRQLRREYKTVITPRSVKQGFDQIKELTKYQGRWQVLQKSPLVICDSGHNADGIKEVMKEILRIPFDKLHFVFGMVKDKDRATIFPVLPKEALYYFCRPDIPRGLDEKELQQEASAADFKGDFYPSVKDAVQKAIASAGNNDVVFIGGSSFVVAEAL